MSWDAQRVSFGAMAATYDSFRPGWPASTAVWLTGTEPGSGREGAVLDVIDLGAGTGKLTRSLAALGHTVTAVDPSEGMLAVLAQALPQVSTVRAEAENIPLPDASADVITVAQAWHWFRQPEAALECARVLRPGGLLAVGWYQRDESVSWVAELNEIAGRPLLGDDAQHTVVRRSGTAVELPAPFGPIEEAGFHYTLELPPAALADLASSWSYVDARPDREQVLEQVRQLGESVAAGQGDPEVLAVPHLTSCYRSRTAVG